MTKVEKRIKKIKHNKYNMTSMRVPLFEVDMGQGVYHGNYFHLFETARDNFFRDIGYPYKALMAEHLHLAIAKIVCTYRASLTYDDIIKIHTGVSRWRKRSMEMFQKIYRENKEGKPVLCTEATFNMVCVSFKGGATSMPPELVKCLEMWADENNSSGNKVFT